ncbi:MAG: 8-oxo-dGTP diphosphatase [Eubacteriaceae bacterium]|nr:8-oxo-dGTP diphosphatase [Eubacteriaceae bacterium]
MKETTLCYIKRKDDSFKGEGQREKVLMLYRNKKKKDMNQGKWIGVGGKLEPGESPEECLLREVFEETGLKITSFKSCGQVNFILDAWEDEITYLFTADEFEGQLVPAETYVEDNEKSITRRFLCPEGELAWIDREYVMELNLWEGDRLFLENLLDEKQINLTLHYDEDDMLVEVIDCSAK